MHQYNPQPGPGYDSELRETKPVRLPHEVSNLVSHFQNLEQSIYYQHHLRVASTAQQAETEESLESRPHTFNPVHTSVTPEQMTQPEVRGNQTPEMREMEASTRAEIANIHATNAEDTSMTKDDYGLTA